MQLSKRITGLTGGGSDGWDVYYKANRMTADGVDVIHLTQGEHDIGTHRSILEAMHEAALAGHTGYTDFNGTARLRERVARRLTERTGIRTTPDNVQIAPGGQSALFAAHSATCDEGDTTYCHARRLHSVGSSAGKYQRWLTDQKSSGTNGSSTMAIMATIRKRWKKVVRFMIRGGV